MNPLSSLRNIVQSHSADRVDISVIIPAYNEENRIAHCLAQIADYFTLALQNVEIIIVDDGSTDGTIDVIESLSINYPLPIRLLQLPENRGKGAAVKAGMLAGLGNYLLFADADGATEFHSLSNLLEQLQKGADIAIGSRATGSSDTILKTSAFRKYLGRAFNLIVNLAIVPGISDTQCGFKLFTRPAAKFLFHKQTSEGFSFDVELLYLSRQVGFTVVEVPVNWINQEGSKVNVISDSLKMLKDVLRFRRIHQGVDRAGFNHFSQTLKEHQSIHAHKRALHEAAGRTHTPLT